jgi:hypothetical protein
MSGLLRSIASVAVLAFLATAVPADADAARWRLARKIAKRPSTAKRFGATVANEGIRRTVTLPTPTGETAFEFMKLSNGDLTLRPLKTYVTWRNGTVATYNQGTSFRTIARTRAIGGKLETVVELVLGPGARVPIETAIYDPTTGIAEIRSTGGGTKTLALPRGLAAGIELRRGLGLI